jgi:hypothetical protein
LPIVRDALTAKVCDTLNSQESGTLSSEVSDNLSSESVAETCRGSLTSRTTAVLPLPYGTATKY